MNGIEIEYLLGLYFTVVSVSRTDGKIVLDEVKFVLGLLLVACAFFGKALI